MNITPYIKSFSSLSMMEQQPLSTINITLNDNVIENIRQSHKSDQLTHFLTNLNLKKSGNKNDKIQRLINHFQSHNINDMDQSSLQNYCDFFKIPTDKLSKNELITQLMSLGSGQQQTNDHENIQSSITEPIIEIDTTVADNTGVLTNNEHLDIATLSMIEIDPTNSFLHKNPIDICSRVVFPNESCILFETSRISHLSESAVIVNAGGTIILTTAVSKLKTTVSFEDNLDLKVDAHERSFSRGYIPSGIHRQDAGITDYEILLCRMIDRSIRPLFINNDDNINNISPPYEVQILSNLLSCDDMYDTQVLAINGASASIYLSSNININGNDINPIGAVRVIINNNDEMICNPKISEIETSKCNLLYVGTEDNCVMIETDTNNVIDDDIYIDLLKYAQKNVKQIVNSIRELKQKNDNRLDIVNDIDNDIINKYKILSDYKQYLLNNSDIITETKTNLFNLYSDESVTKNNRNNKRNELCKYMTDELIKKYETDDFNKNDIITLTPNNSDVIINELLSLTEWKEFYKSLFYDLDKNEFRSAYISNSSRCDGRLFNEVRSLNHDVAVLPSSHGSSLFERGSTQTLCSTTLGPPKLSRMRNLHKSGHPLEEERLYFQYEMAPSSTNEIKAIQSKNRRAIGHANIACNALKPLLPSFSEFPYSIRIFSNITASDGSSSMASVCGGSLSLMDAGVPLSQTVGGISIGLINGMLLTDIAGIEDHFGDMDFKIAGTINGITSVQLDIKRPCGISLDTLCLAVRESLLARRNIISSMENTICTSRDILKSHAPRVEILNINFRDIPRVLGSGGATKKKIMIESNSDIEIYWEEEQIEITSPNILLLNKAKQLIYDAIGSQCRIGDIISAKIKSIQSFGVLIEINDGTEHFIHTSQWIDDNIDQSTLINTEIDVMCIGFLGENRPNFSRKAAIWQLSDDPEDRARLQLLLSSLRPPGRSQSHPGHSVGGTSSSSSGAISSMTSFFDREPSSIFGDDQNINDNGDGIQFDVNEDQMTFSDKQTSIQTTQQQQQNDDDTNDDDDNDNDDDDDESTFPSILPPKNGFSFNLKNEKQQEKRSVNNNNIMKDLIDNISNDKPIGSTDGSSSSRNGGISGTQSRFASLYKGIQDGDDNGDNNDNKDNDDNDNDNKQIEQQTTVLHSSRIKNDNNNKSNGFNEKKIDGWRKFTNDLMGSNNNDIQKDDKGDHLLLDLFGEKHRNNDDDNDNDNDNSSLSSRASELMDTIPNLVNDLKNDINDNNDQQENKDDFKWPWQEKEL